ncbi:MAG: helix-turn-helix domain-containing protein [Clostridia bacterium]|nr:helix-turn-helix domain-containing protein [Clostridia bacterium]MDE6677323.1 helix-turn-helix domain-containing protein [Clostridia bacterium]
MNKTFGIRLKELRNEKNLTQAEVAKIFGVSKTTICQWETSKQEPSLNDVLAIAKFFEVTTDYLLGAEE